MCLLQKDRTVTAGISLIKPPPIEAWVSARRSARPLATAGRLTDSGFQDRRARELATRRTRRRLDRLGGRTLAPTACQLGTTLDSPTWKPTSTQRSIPQLQPSANEHRSPESRAARPRRHALPGHRARPPRGSRHRSTTPGRPPQPRQQLHPVYSGGSPRSLHRPPPPLFGSRGRNIRVRGSSARRAPVSAPATRPTLAGLAAPVQRDLPRPRRRRATRECYRSRGAWYAEHARVGAGCTGSPIHDQKPTGGTAESRPKRTRARPRRPSTSSTTPRASRAAR